MKLGNGKRHGNEALEMGGNGSEKDIAVSSQTSATASIVPYSYTT